MVESGPFYDGDEPDCYWLYRGGHHVSIMRGKQTVGTIRHITITQPNYDRCVEAAERLVEAMNGG